MHDTFHTCVQKRLLANYEMIVATNYVNTIIAQELQLFIKVLIQVQRWTPAETKKFWALSMMRLDNKNRMNMQK